MSVDEEEEFSDNDIPETGAVFSFGPTLPEKFWIGREKAITQVSCGEEHTCVLSEAGKIYTFGKNNWGQLGIGPGDASDVPRFVKALKGEHITHIACGRNHTLAYSASFKLYGFGCNGESQITDGQSETIHLPVVNAHWKQAVKLKMLAAGGEFSALLTSAGQMYTWGSNDMGQLGVGSQLESTGQPQLVKFPGSVVYIACGHYHAGAALENGHLYMWGEAEGGKLGLHEEADDSSVKDEEDEDPPKPFNKPIFEPNLVESLKESGVSMVECGLSHTLAVSRDQRVYAWGQGSLGQLGLGVKILQTQLPSPLERSATAKLKVHSIAAGENHSALVLVDGSMFTFGDIRHGKLGLPSEDNMNQFLPARVKRLLHLNVFAVHCGGCHTVALAKRIDPPPASSPLEDGDSPSITPPVSNSQRNSLRLSTLSWASLDKDDNDLTLSGELDETHRNKKTRANFREKRRNDKQSPTSFSTTLPQLQYSPRVPKDPDRLHKTLPPSSNPDDATKDSEMKENIKPKDMESSSKQDEPAKSPIPPLLPEPRRKRKDLPKLDPDLQEKPEEIPEPPIKQRGKPKPIAKPETEVVPKGKDTKPIEKGFMSEEDNEASEMEPENEEVMAKVKSGKVEAKKTKPNEQKEQNPEKIKPTPKSRASKEPMKTEKEDEEDDEDADENEPPPAKKVPKPTTRGKKGKGDAAVPEEKKGSVDEKGNPGEDEEEGEGDGTKANPGEEEAPPKKGCGNGNRRCTIL